MKATLEKPESPRSSVPDTAPAPAVVTKNIKTPDPITEEGIQNSVDIMKTGRLYRYNCDSAETSEVSKIESELAAYTGHKYCVSLNSCGSGIFLMLKCIGVEPGDKVLTNVFTFAAVPSAIVHANAEPVYVNCTPGFILDIEDLEKKAKEERPKVCVVSHMRGKVSDMDKVKEICDRYDIILVEDCAHSLGVYWNGTHTGHHGVACAFSSQSYKMLNSGEGGFLMTNDDHIAAKAMCYAGSYEKLYVKHSSCPPHEVMEQVRHETPNFSMRMHEVTAAMLRPQIPTLDERKEKYNERYYRVEKKLQELECISIEPQLPQVSICGDSIQFNVSGVSEEELVDFQDLCKARGVITEVFGAASNARNFKNWHFAALPPPDCEPTHEIIKYAVDLRLPLLFDDEEIDLMADIILESMQAVLDARGLPSGVVSSTGARAAPPVMSAAREPAPASASGPEGEDLLLRQMSGNGEVSVLCVEGTELVAEAARRHGLSPTATAALGRTLMGALLMGTFRGEDEQTQVTFNGQGPLGMIKAIATHDAQVRGLIAGAKVHLPLRADGKLDVGGGVGLGTLAVVRSHPAMKEPFTGVTAIVSGEIAEDLAQYMTESEQTNCAIGLGVLVNIDEATGSTVVQSAGGYMVQVLPSASEETLTQLEENLKGMPSPSDAVRQGLRPSAIVEQLLQGLGTDSKAQQSTTPTYGPCELDGIKTRMRRAISTLPAAELEEILREEGQVEMTCEMCKETARWGREDLAEDLVPAAA